MAHQDTVPSMDPRQWAYPPFQAHFDGEWLWGRGSADCKSNMIGILSALEALLEQDFSPKRSILLAFGFDEEVGGFQGAAEIARHLVDNLGRDSPAMVFDEGGMEVKTLGDVAYALPGKFRFQHRPQLISLASASVPSPHNAHFDAASLGASALGARCIAERREHVIVCSECR